MIGKEYLLSPVSLQELEELIKKCVQEGIATETKAETKVHEEFLTIKEAAEFLKVSLVSIHNWKREKNLPFYRLGRSIRFLKKDLIAFAEVKRKGRRNL